MFFSCDQKENSAPSSPSIPAEVYPDTLQLYRLAQIVAVGLLESSVNGLLTVWTDAQDVNWREDEQLVETATASVSQPLDSLALSFKLHAWTEDELQSWHARGFPDEQMTTHSKPSNISVTAKQPIHQPMVTLPAGVYQRLVTL